MFSSVVKIRHYLDIWMFSSVVKIRHYLDIWMFSSVMNIGHYFRFSVPLLLKALFKCLVLLSK